MNRRITDAEMDQLIKEAFEVTDDQLAEVMDRAKEEAEQQGELLAAPPKGGFEDVMRRVAESEKEETPKQKVFRVKKVIRPLLVAAVLGTIVLGTGIGASGQREFEFVKWIKGEYSRGYDNVDSMNISGDTEIAYRRIRDEIGIRPIMLEYIPAEMVFEELIIEDGRATMMFSYKGNRIYFQQTLKSFDISINTISDKTIYKEIEHYRFDTIFVYQNKLVGENPEYGAQFTLDNAYYHIEGIIEEDEFIKIVERLAYYE